MSVEDAPENLSKKFETVSNSAPSALGTQISRMGQISTFPESKNGLRYLVLDWPLPVTGITSLFGPRRDPIDGSTKHHTGIDLDADYGAVVTAPAHGTVLFADWRRGNGRWLLLEHAGGIQTAYSHLSQLLVAKGAVVHKGQPIGRVGNSGRSTGPHLHFEIHVNHMCVDPLDYLATPIQLN